SPVHGVKMTKAHVGLVAIATLTVALCIAILPTGVSGQEGSRQTAAHAGDLTGIWSNVAVVPFERSPAYGNRELLTDEEHKKALAQLLERNKRPGRDSRESQGQNIRGTEKDVARAYNELFFGDKPTEVGRRTSMIVDPPDGRMPALTPEARKR